MTLTRLWLRLKSLVSFSQSSWQKEMAGSNEYWLQVGGDSPHFAFWITKNFVMQKTSFGEMKTTYLKLNFAFRRLNSKKIFAEKTSVGAKS